MRQQNSLEYRIVKAMYMIEKGRLSESESLLENIVNETPDSALHWSLYAYVTSCFGRQTEFNKAVEMAQKLAITDGTAIFNIGVAMKRIKDPSWRGTMKKAAKLDSSLTEVVKIAMKEDFPTAIVRYPEGSEEIIGQIITGAPKVPQISKAKPVDHYIDVIPGMIRKVRGCFLRHEVETRAGYYIGSVFVRLEDMVLEMRYGPDSKGVIPKSGTIVTVTIEDGRMPRIVEISDKVDDPLDSPAYAEVPFFSRKGRWPKMCCSCGEIRFKELKPHTAKWDGEINLQRTEFVVQPELKTNWAKLGVFSLSYIVGMLFDVPHQVSSSVAKGIADKVPDNYENYVKALEIIEIIEMHLAMKLYLCKKCKKQKKDFASQISIEPRAFDDGFPDLKFKFHNKDYAKVFHDHNPDGIYPEVSTKKEAKTLAKAKLSKLLEKGSQTT